MKHAGISYFLAPMKVPGVEVQPLVKLTGEGGFNQVIWSNARIPGDALIGREGQGWEIAMATLQFERGAAEGSAGGSWVGSEQIESLIRLARGLAPTDGRCSTTRSCATGSRSSGSRRRRCARTGRASACPGSSRIDPRRCR